MPENRISNESVPVRSPGFSLCVFLPDPRDSRLKPGLRTDRLHARLFCQLPSACQSRGGATRGGTALCTGLRSHGPSGRRRALVAANGCSTGFVARAFPEPMQPQEVRTWRRNYRKAPQQPPWLLRGFVFHGRGGGIRTPDLLVPNQSR